MHDCICRRAGSVCQNLWLWCPCWQLVMWTAPCMMTEVNKFRTCHPPSWTTPSTWMLHTSISSRKWAHHSHPNTQIHTLFSDKTAKPIYSGYMHVYCGYHIQWIIPYTVDICMCIVDTIYSGYMHVYCGYHIQWIYACVLWVPYTVDICMCIVGVSALIKHAYNILLEHTPHSSSKLDREMTDVPLLCKELYVHVPLLYSYLYQLHCLYIKSFPPRHKLRCKG